ncbi:hypothetical protein B296_00018067 [Ensete ventricosum]|uniref:Uncharacterized protein n=1 Tax=Ensete ventricosum TaxID=4639 RepID=A0A426XP71_ENSVE|nr:hypothetical protein B296_00018067 [Ensete ventricosum]
MPPPYGLSPLPTVGHSRCPLLQSSFPPCCHCHCNPLSQSPPHHHPPVHVAAALSTASSSVSHRSSSPPLHHRRSLLFPFFPAPHLSPLPPIIGRCLPLFPAAVASSLPPLLCCCHPLLLLPYRCTVASPPLLVPQRIRASVVGVAAPIYRLQSHPVGAHPCFSHTTTATSASIAVAPSSAATAPILPSSSPRYCLPLPPLPQLLLLAAATLPPPSSLLHPRLQPRPPHLLSSASIPPCCRSRLQPRPPHLLPSVATSIAALPNYR